MVSPSVNDFIAQALGGGEAAAAAAPTTTELSGGRKRTASGLMRKPNSRRFMENSRGRVVSRKRSMASKRAYERSSRIRNALEKGQALARSGQLQRYRKGRSLSRKSPRRSSPKKARRRSARLRAGVEGAATDAAANVEGGDGLF